MNYGLLKQLVLNAAKSLPRHTYDRRKGSRLNFKRRIKSHLPFAGIIRISPYSTRFQDKG